MTLLLHFAGHLPTETLRDGIGRALDALGAPRGAWVLEEELALEDRNGAGRAGVRRWRRGDARLLVRAESGEGNPRDGYGYDVTLALEGPRWAFRVTSGSMDGSFWDVRLPWDGDTAGFRAVRRALGEAFSTLGPDVDRTARADTATQNLAALEGRDAALQSEILREALAHTRPEDHAHAELLRWRERLLGTRLRARLEESPADLDAWERAREAPPSGWALEAIEAVVARLAPYETSSHALASAWRWIPWLGGDGRAPTGWRQLDDGVNPTWARPALAAHLVRALDPDLARVASISDGRAADRPPRGVVETWARWPDGAPGSTSLPRARVRFTHVERPLDFVGAAFIDWIWGDGAEDLALLAQRLEPSPPSPPALFLAGSTSFQRRVLGALHALEPFAWRPVAEPLVASFRPPRPTAAGTRREVRALLDALTEEGEEVAAIRAAFEACRCDDRFCEHADVLLDAQRAAQRALQGDHAPRRRAVLDATMRACDAASAVRGPRGQARYAIAQAWQSLDRARATTDPPA